MSDIEAYLKEYFEILDIERDLAQRKQRIRAHLFSELTACQERYRETPYGRVERRARFRLNPRREAILALLSADDLYPFARFTPNRVKEDLVPKYGREALLPLFDIHKSESLVVKRPGAAESLGLT